MAEKGWIFQERITTEIHPQCAEHSLIRLGNLPKVCCARAINNEFISVGILTGLEVNNISEGDPLKILRDVDPEFLKVFTDTENLAFSEGALTAKTKTLVAMAIDATHGSVQGVVALAQEAIELGATKEEIIEALRVAYYIGGAGAIYTAAYALQTIFPSNK